MHLGDLVTGLQTWISVLRRPAYYWWSALLNRSSATLESALPEAV